jgi:hypothetical protein
MEFAVATGDLEGGKTVCARFAELVNVSGHAGPKETLSDAMEGFVATKVSSGGAGVIGVEEDRA